MVKFFMVFFLFLDSSYADLGLGKAFDRLGMRHNVTGPGAYKSQASGYYDGGSVEVRYQDHTFRPFALSLPTAEIMNCQASLFMGGFDLFKGKELVKSLKAIATGFGSYGLMLAIDVLSPQIGNNMRWMKKVQNTLNNMSIRGCRTGMELGQGLAMKSEVLSRHICTRYEAGGGSYGGLGSAAGDCSRKKRLQDDSIKNAKKASPGMQVSLVGDFNTAWIVMNKNHYLEALPTEMKMFLMSLTGTLVSHNGKRKAYPSKLKSLIAPMMRGGVFSGGYTCSDKECLNVVTNRDIGVSPELSFIGRAEAMLQHIAKTTLDDNLEADTTKIKAFVDSSNLPVLKMIYVNVALERGLAFLNTGRYAENIAYDILYNYLNGLITSVGEAAASLEGNQFEPGELNAYKKNLATIKNDIASYRADLYRKTQTRFKFVEETQIKEKQLGSKVNWEI